MPFSSPPVTGAALLASSNVFTANGTASTSVVTLTGTPFAGTGTTAFPLLYLNQTGATAATGLSTAGTFFGINISGSQDIAHWLKNGATRFKVDADGVGTLGSSAIAGGGTVLNLVSSYGTCTIQVTGGGAFVTSSVLATSYIYCPGIIFNSDLFLNRKAAASFGLGSASATPIAQTFGAANGSGTNITGGTLNIGTQGTGTGVGGRINLQHHAAGSSGSTLGTLVDVLSIVGAGRVRITNIPTSSAGLSTGDIYSNAGILTIV
jgi:hypothetical protein